MNVAIVGDVLVKSFCDQTKKTFENALKIICERNDIVILNLEGAISYSNKKNPKWGPCIKNTPDILDVLKKFQSKLIINLSNNHISDWGEIGIQDTIDVLDKYEIKWLGVKTKRSNVIAQRIGDVHLIAYADNEFNLISQLGYGCYAWYDDEILDYISQNREKFIIAYGHIGLEYSRVETKIQTIISNIYKIIGVSYHVNTHSHRCEAVEENSVDKCFGLGNFYFPKENESSEWNKGLIVEIKINKNEAKRKEISYSEIEWFEGYKSFKISKRKLVDNIELKRLRKESEKIQKVAAIKFFFPFHFRGYMKILNQKIMETIGVKWAKRRFRINQISSDVHRESIENFLKEKND